LDLSDLNNHTGKSEAYSFQQARSDHEFMAEIYNSQLHIFNQLLA